MAARQIIRGFRRRVEAKTAEAIDELPAEAGEVTMENLGV